MASRTAEVKSYVSPEVKAAASEVYARWGMSLSDAVNTFLIKSVEVGGLPFNMRPDPKPTYSTSTVLPTDPVYESSILPTDMDDDEDGLYDKLID